jgi:2-dehydro-3-deoxyphosphogluconate aldolase / (4S)-4-hydroxy-2-oxoglutarate aldolase
VLSPEQVFPNRVAGVIRARSSEIARDACLAALEGGLGTVEVTTSVPSWESTVRDLVEATSAPVGVGTVLDAPTVERAQAAGARFVVTPVLVPEVATACRRLDLFCVLGAASPTEIYQARQAGADVVKVFPIASLGGPDYLRYLAGPLPGLPLWVSGGVGIEEVDSYLRLGVAAVGLTTAVFPPELLKAGDWGGIRELARRASMAAAALV